MSPNSLTVSVGGAVPRPVLLGHVQLVEALDVVLDDGDQQLVHVAEVDLVAVVVGQQAKLVVELLELDRLEGRGVGSSTRF